MKVDGILFFPMTWWNDVHHKNKSNRLQQYNLPVIHVHPSVHYNDRPMAIPCNIQTRPVSDNSVLTKWLSNREQICKTSHQKCDASYLMCATSFIRTDYTLNLVWWAKTRRRLLCFHNSESQLPTNCTRRPSSTVYKTDDTAVWDKLNSKP